ncbi:hypothetical protein FRC19_006439 [Serendipita sp. 401]|nr:hypothetical protein FRC15_000225 [Serendipita sp. 397]KAG8782462.1 hypothetical protein FRC16_002613 [Serendipita sp. 398]KAG8828341.1 hypothetical protein FRC19_006439 [Serendipita sp. 401]KAG8858132.1 hypothetical protein FRC20_012082 [Serendipita sp. 405]
MENLSVIDCVPVELWHGIFLLALQTWLSPNDAGDVIDGILLFYDRCESVVEYKRIENTRKQLRAVCRIWKAVVDDLGISFTFSDFSDDTELAESELPTATRFEFRWKQTCECERCPHLVWNDPWDPGASPREYERRVTAPRHMATQNLDTFDPEQVRVILFRDRVADIRSVSHWAAFGGSIRGLDSQDEIQGGPVFERLTHLSLSVWPDRLKGTYRFPHLRFLQLSLNMGMYFWYPTSSYAPLSNWALPKLVSLVVRGESSDRYEEDLLRFLHSHVSKIQDLVLGYKNDHHMPYRVDMELLRQYPRLKTLGLALDTLSSITDDLGNKEEGIESKEGAHIAPAAPSLICKSLLLDKFIQLIELGRDLLQYHAEQCVRLCAPPTALFERTVIAYSWEELCNLYERRMACQTLDNCVVIQQLPSPVVFFETVYQSGIKFIDREGVELREGSGLRFLERMREIDRDPESLVASRVDVV